jgi:alpha-ketoglutarate-dependent taurine dioxygenase
MTLAKQCIRQPVIRVSSRHLKSALRRRISLSLDPRMWPVTPPNGLTAELVAICRRALIMVLDEPGFSVIEMDVGELTDAGICTAAWNIFAALCKPIPQYRSGEMICNVEVSSERVGVSHYLSSNMPGGYHTDGTLLNHPPDVVALFGLEPADIGGATILVDARKLCDQLNQLNPSHICTLSLKHHFDTRGQIDGQVTKKQRILLRDSNRFELRYLSYFIKEGYKKAGEVISPALVDAMEALESLAEDQTNQIRILLRRGTLLIWDNHRFLHAREAFEEQRKRRRLRRIYGVQSVDRSDDRDAKRSSGAMRPSLQPGSSISQERF